MMQPSQMAIMIKAFSHRLHTYRITSLHWVNTRQRMEKERKNVNVRWIYLKRFFQANHRIELLIRFTSSNFAKVSVFKKVSVKGSGGGSVDRAVAFDTRDPWLESQHQQKIYVQIVH